MDIFLNEGDIKVVDFSQQVAYTSTLNERNEKKKIIVHYTNPPEHELKMLCTFSITVTLENSLSLSLILYYCLLPPDKTNNMKVKRTKKKKKIEKTVLHRKRKIIDEKWLMILAAMNVEWNNVGIIQLFI